MKLYSKTGDSLCSIRNSNNNNNLEKFEKKCRKIKVEGIFTLQYIIYKNNKYC